MTPRKPCEEGGAAFFPITKYCTNEQINELNNKYYMSFTVFRELFLYSPIVLSGYSDNFLLMILFSSLPFISFSFGLKRFCIYSPDRFDDFSLKISVT